MFKFNFSTRIPARFPSQWPRSGHYLMALTALASVLFINLPQSAGTTQAAGRAALVTAKTSPARQAAHWPRLPGVIARPMQAVEGLSPAPRQPASAGISAPLPAGTTRVPLLEYHSTTFYLFDEVRMTTEWFEAQMRWLSENDFTALTAEELAAFIHGEYRPPAHAVVLTFDVGGQDFDNYANIIIPALRRYNLHAIFFVQAYRIHERCGEGFTCWDVLAQWKAEGLISIGSHGMFHYDFATLTPEQIKYDAGRAKEILEEKLGGPVLGFSYPFDSAPAQAWPILEKLGYQFAAAGATRADRSAQFNDASPYTLPRYYPYSGEATYPVISGNHGQTFDQILLGAVSQP